MLSQLMPMISAASSSAGYSSRRYRGGFSGASLRVSPLSLYMIPEALHASYVSCTEAAPAAPARGAKTSSNQLCPLLIGADHAR